MEHREQLLDLGPVLETAEASSPVDAVESVTRDLVFVRPATVVLLGMSQVHRLRQLPWRSPRAMTPSIQSIVCS